MVKSNIFKALTALCLVAPTACATATRGPNVKFHVVTDPPGATVTTDMKTRDMRTQEVRKKRLLKQGAITQANKIKITPEYRGCDPTPCWIHVSRKSEFTTTIELEGYHPVTVDVTSGFGKGQPGNSAGGAAITAAGGYVVTYTVASAALSPFVALFGAGSAATSTASSMATSAATTAATGIGISFIAIDLVSGAMLDVQPNPLVVVLVPDTEPLPEENKLIETAQELEQVLAERQSAS